MSLAQGTRLGPYEIRSLIGAGGMGEVYLARDTTLHRDVALKILPDSVAADPDRIARFEREARTLAALNHPNIAHIYGLEAGEGGRALVMELVEGPTLSDRVSQGPVPSKEALSIAKQIADALEAAHDRGIVHRDLKPANVKLTSEGIVKVLDFGLAKALEAGGPESGTVLATMTSPAMTRAGVILGTAAYMSPEQARGRVVDARTDIWAFGCVVFEMLTGRGPFDGETVTDVLGAIVHKDPEWTTLPASTPASVRRLLERCLAKDPKQRLHNIADARLELEDLIAGSSRPDVASAAALSGGGSGRMRPRERAAWALAGIASVALVAGAWGVTSGRWLARRSEEVRALQLSILHPDGSEVAVPAISPDGRRVAYRARRADGMPFIWVRDLDRSTPRALSGTEDGKQPFWSPDSKNVGFVVGNVLKRIPAEGGPVQEIVRPVVAGATWGPNDAILYAPPDSAIQQVSANGGPPTPVTTLPSRDWGHSWPSFLPDGRHFLFTARMWTGLAESSAQGIYLGSVDTPSNSTRLLSDLTNAVFVPGSIVFVRDGRLMAVAFNAETGRVTGEPVPIDESVAEDPSSYAAGLSSASDGTLALRPPPAGAAMASHTGGGFQSELRMLKRDGSVVSTFGGLQWFSDYIAVSPDARYVVAIVLDPRSGSQDLWRFDAQSGTRVAMTSMRSTGGYVGQPVWSADGTRLAYACQSPGTMDDVCVKDVQSGTVARLFETKSWEHPVAWSGDDQSLLVAFNDRTPSSISELRVWSKRSGTLTPYVKRRGSVLDGAFSPDSRFVAYSSLESGRYEVYVTTFPDVRQTWPLTTEGARAVSWSADGKEIMVATLTGHIAVYPVTTAFGGFTAGAPQVLRRNVGFDAVFARPTRDHSRIVVRVAKDADKDQGEIRLLFGWQKPIQSAVAPR